MRNFLFLILLSLVLQSAQAATRFTMKRIGPNRFMLYVVPDFTDATKGFSALNASIGIPTPASGQPPTVQFTITDSARNGAVWTNNSGTAANPTDGDIAPGITSYSFYYMVSSPASVDLRQNVPFPIAQFVFQGRPDITADVSLYDASNGNSGSITQSAGFSLSIQDMGNVVDYTSPSTLFVQQPGPDGTNLPGNGPASGVFVLTTAAPTPLPVNLISFDAYKRGSDKAEVKWEVSNEDNISHYEVERSSDGAAFSLIGKVVSHNKTTRESYSFQDFSVLNGVSFYRLKIIERNSNAFYSALKKLQFETSLNYTLSPVPVSGILKIKGTLSSELIRVISATGITIINEKASDAESQLDMSHFPSGVYHLEILDSNQIRYSARVNKL